MSTRAVLARLGNANASRLTGALLAASALSLSACGGSSSNGVVHPPVQAARGVPPIPRFVGAGSVHQTRSGPVRAYPAPANAIDDEVNASGAKTIDPCTLVSRSQAQAILHLTVERTIDAPQGPTCIYQPEGKAGMVTLALQATAFSKVAPQAQLRHRQSLSVGGNTAYCGKDGSSGASTLVIPLSASRFLTVTAPCALASQFAAAAMRHLAT